MRKFRHQRSRADNNQKEIVKALRKIPNLTVEVEHDDFLVGWEGVTYWFECKNPEKVLDKKGKLKPDALKESQIKLLANFTGHYSVVWTLDQILEEIGIK